MEWTHPGGSESVCLCHQKCHRTHAVGALGCWQHTIYSWHVWLLIHVYVHRQIHKVFVAQVISGFCLSVGQILQVIQTYLYDTISAASVVGIE